MGCIESSKAHSMEVKLDKINPKATFAFHDNFEEDLQIIRIDTELIYDFTEEEIVEFRTRKNDIEPFDCSKANRRTQELRKSTILKLQERGLGKERTSFSFDKFGYKKVTQNNPNLIKISSVIL